MALTLSSALSIAATEKPFRAKIFSNGGKHGFSYRFGQARRAQTADKTVHAMRSNTVVMENRIKMAHIGLKNLHAWTGWETIGQHFHKIGIPFQRQESRLAIEAFDNFRGDRTGARPKFHHAARRTEVGVTNAGPSHKSA